MTTALDTNFPEYHGVDFENYDFEHCWTRVERNGAYSAMDVIAAILRTSGVYTEMAQLLGRNRARVRDYVMANPEVYEVWSDVREAALDRVEKGLFLNAESGDGASQRFIMGTLGKDRGYSTRVESTGKDGAPLRGSEVDLSKLSEEELEQFIELRRKAAAIGTGTAD